MCKNLQGTFIYVGLGPVNLPEALTSVVSKINVPDYCGVSSVAAALLLFCHIFSVSEYTAFLTTVCSLTF